MGYLQHGRRHLPGGTDPIKYTAPPQFGWGISLSTNIDPTGLESTPLPFDTVDWDSGSGYVVPFADVDDWNVVVPSDGSVPGSGLYVVEFGQLFALDSPPGPGDLIWAIEEETDSGNAYAADHWIYTPALTGNSAFGEPTWRSHVHALIALNAGDGLRATFKLLNGFALASGDSLLHAAGVTQSQTFFRGHFIGAVPSL